MEIFILIGVFILAVLLIALIFIQVQGRKQKPDTTLLVIQQQMDSMRKQLQESLSSTTSQVNQQLGLINQQLQASSGQMGSRLDNAARVVGEVRQNLGELSKATQRIFDVGRDIASLQDILRAPKLRGIIGELLLGELLAQILPTNHFTLQHRFKSGETVDAVIQLGDHLVPIDSKFPLENFKRVIEGKSDDERHAGKRKFITDVKSPPESG